MISIVLKGDEIEPLVVIVPKRPKLDLAIDERLVSESRARAKTRLELDSRLG